MSPTQQPGTDIVQVLWRWTEQTPNAVSRARTSLQCALEQLDFTGEGIDDAVLAASELVANAFEHATGPYEMRLRITTGPRLICEVMDTDPRIPVVPGFRNVAPLKVPAGRRGWWPDRGRASAAARTYPSRWLPRTTRVAPCRPGTPP